MSVVITGAREVLGFTVGEREHQSAWADLLLVMFHSYDNVSLLLPRFDIPVRLGDLL